MNFSFFSVRLLRLVLAGLLGSALASMRAQNLASDTLTKSQMFLQSGPGAVAPDLPYPFQLLIDVQESFPGSVLDANLLLGPTNSSGAYGESGFFPPHSVQEGVFPPDPLGWQFRLFATNEVWLDIIWAQPTWYYDFLVAPVYPDAPLTLSLPGADYPNAPRALNYSAAQSVNATNDFVLLWNNFLGGGANDFIQLRILDNSNNVAFSTPDLFLPGWLDGTAQSAAIPAGTLAPGRAYQAQIWFSRLTEVDTTSYPGAVGSAGFVAQTRFNLVTLPASPVNDLPDAVDYALAKIAAFVQTAPAEAEPDPVAPLQFQALVDSSFLGALLGATLSSTNLTYALEPGPPPLSLGLSDSFSSQTGLDAAWPAGNYTLSLATLDNGKSALGFDVPSTTFPVTPLIGNFSAAQTVTTTNDFVLSWSPFTGAGPNDFIRLEITDINGNPLIAPAPLFSPRSLSATNLSWTIPAGTFQPGHTYQGVLQFCQVADFASGNVSISYGGATFIAQTSFPITTLDLPPPPLDVSLTSLTKQQNFMQTMASSVVADASAPFQASLTVTQTTNGTVNFAVAFLPNGLVQQLEPVTNSLALAIAQAFPDSPSVEAAFPGGGYIVSISTVDAGHQLAEFPVPTLPDYPDPPQIANLASAQTIQPANSFNLAWQSDPGAAADTIQLWIADANGAVVFPTNSVPAASLALDGSATSATIPAGTLAPSSAYTGHLLFSRTSSFTTPSYSDPSGYPDGDGAVVFTSATSFPLVTLPGPPAPRFTAESYSPATGMALTLTGGASQNYAIQASADLATWTTLTVTNSATGVIQFTDTHAVMSTQSFYRAVTR